LLQKKITVTLDNVTVDMCYKLCTPSHYGSVTIAKKVLQQRITVTLDKCSNRYINVLQRSNTFLYIKEHIFRVTIDQSIVTWLIGTHKKMCY